MYKKNKIAILAFTLFATGGAQAQGDAAAGKTKVEMCVGCHGEDGNASAPIFPKLAGQHTAYLDKQLKEFKSQKRVEPTMNAMSESLSDADIADIAAYFSKNKIKPEPVEANPTGEKLYRSGNATAGLPACSSCHGPNGSGNPLTAYPALGGQYAAYLSKTLHDYKAGERSNDPNGIMRGIAARLNEEEINAVAEYASGLK